MFSASAMLDWGSSVNGSLTGPMGSNMGGLGADTRSSAGGVWPEPAGTILDAGVDDDAFTIVSDDQLVRADNTALAWNGSAWLPAFFVNSSNTYVAGHFNAPCTPTSQPQFGDNLLGALAPSGGDNGPPTITLKFATALSYVAFQVSSASNSQFYSSITGLQCGRRADRHVSSDRYWSRRALFGPFP